MLFFHVTLTLFLLAIFYLDMTKYIIPNWICGVLLGLYPAMLLMTPALPEDYSILWSIGVMLVVFAFGIGIFVLNWAGGGDVKLLTVLALWTGREVALELVIYTALLGGVLALFLVIVRPIVGRFVPAEKFELIPRVLCHHQPLPYGLAITASFLILLWSGQVPGLAIPRGVSLF